MACAPQSQRDDTWEMGKHSIPAAQELSRTAAGATITRKPAPRTGAKSPCVPQRQQGRLGQAYLTKTKQKAVQPELEEVPESRHIKTAAANGTAPLHIPQPSKSCTPSRLEFQLWSPLESFRHLLHCICAQHQPVFSTSLLTATRTTAHHLSLC